MTVSNARMIAELLRMATREERRDAYEGFRSVDSVDLAALDALIDMTPPLVGKTFPRRLTARGSRVLVELLATFEEQT